MGETRRCHHLKEQALSLQGSLLGVAATAAGGDVATAWKAAGHGGWSVDRSRRSIDRDRIVSWSVGRPSVAWIREMARISDFHRPRYVD